LGSLMENGTACCRRKSAKCLTRRQASRPFSGKKSSAVSAWRQIRLRPEKSKEKRHADHRLPFPLVAQIGLRAPLQARQGHVSALRKEHARRLQLCRPRRSPKPELLDRMVRPRRPARTHGWARARGRRGLLARTFFDLVLRLAARR